MALKIRLTRTGKKKVPSYRVVVADERERRQGRFVESLGNYNPRLEQSQAVLKLERIDYWISQGAKPSQTVASILKNVRKAGTSPTPSES